MAEVFLATALDDVGRLQVVKRLHPHLADEPRFLKMFVNEARTVARLNHPNVVQIFNLGQQSGTFFIAMEYVDGLDLRQIRKACDEQGRRVPPGVACEIIMAAAAGLHHAHTKRGPGGRPLEIVHRDVSPHNILLSYSGEVKVVDFGIAKAADQAEETRAGELKGKAPYMSPEQAAGEAVDARTDVFALGVVLHELLTGEHLFKRDSTMAALRAVKEHQVPPPSRIAPGIPPELDRITLRALERNLDARFQTAQEFEQALKLLLSTKKVSGGAQELKRFMSELPVPGATQQSKPSPASPPKERSRMSPQRLVPPPVPADPPDRHPPRPPTQPFQRTPGKRRPLAIWGAIALTALTLIVVLLTILARPSTARVKISSHPPGASVLLDGVPTGMSTPCTLDGVRAGMYELSLKRVGFQEYRTTIRIPAEGEIKFPSIPLVPER